MGVKAGRDPGFLSEMKINIVATSFTFKRGVLEK